MKIVFGNKDEEVVHLDYPLGVFETTNCALIEYRFDKDDTVNLVVDGSWFDKDNLNEFIEFLKAVKEHLNK